MAELSGIRGDSRKRLVMVLRRSTGVITPDLTGKVLNVSPSVAAKVLARWTDQGWLTRVSRGIYVPIALESESADAGLKDPWIVANAAFAPCYVCGFSAAEHWGLTEQVFRTVLIATTRRPRHRMRTLGGISYQLRTVAQAEFFGLKNVWRDRQRVSVTDASRTIVDLMADPRLGGGLRSSIDMFRTYLGDKSTRNVALLVEYATRLGVGAAFKRLGFLLETYAPDERTALARSASSISSGNARLDPASPNGRLVTRWRLWLPTGWRP